MFYLDVLGQWTIKVGIKLNNNIVVVDLDGTFVSVNTFHKWIKFLFIEEVKHIHFSSVFQILRIISMRYLKLINHSEMKFKILKISEQAINEKQIITFVQSLHKYVNHDVLTFIKSKPSTTILATAAPLLYAEKFKDIYSFQYILATPYTGSDNWEENIRNIKKKNLISLLKTYGLNQQVSIFFTDHYDDLPIMKYADLTYLINPNDKTINLTKKENISCDSF